MEYSFDTLCRLLARAALSLSDDENALMRERGGPEEAAGARGRFIVGEEAEDETEVEIITDMSFCFSYSPTKRSSRAVGWRGEREGVSE